MKLYRAIAYRLQRADTPPSLAWPDMTVFFEAPTLPQAKATLPPVLACLWHCQPTDVEFYNLSDENELQGGAGFGGDDLGDAALLVNGWDHGPLFCRADRTLMLVSPPTLARLQAARVVARPFHQQQRAKASLAAEAARASSAARGVRMHERLEGAHATGYGSL